MRNVILREIADPLFRRIGTYVAGLLTAYGIKSETVETIEAALVALLFIGIDLVASHAVRKGSK